MSTGSNLFATTITFTLLAVSALAQEPIASNAEVSPLETVEVVGQLTRYGATKSQVPIVETARSISIETYDQFNDKGALNLSQTATYMAGVSAETFGFATRGDWLRARGHSLPRYRDSIQELFGNYNTTRAETFTIEQVEVLRGPAAVLYGQGSPGGIVNYVSKTPKSERGGELMVRGGSFDRMELGVDLTGPFSQGDDTWSYRLVALYRDSDSQVDYVEDNTRLLMPSISWQPSAATRITFLGLVQDTESDSGSQFVPVEGTLQPLANGGFLNPDVYIGEPGFNRFDTESRQLTLLASHEFNEFLGIEATALRRDGEADYHQAWPAFLGSGASRYINGIFGPVLASDTIVPRTFYQADNEFEQTAIDVRLRATFDTGVVQHEVLAGVQYQAVETDNNLSYFFGGGAFAGDFSYVLDLQNPVYTGAPDQAVFDAIYFDQPTQNVDDYGLYISNLMSIGEWRITMGARFDEVDNDNGVLSQSDSDVSLSAGVLYRFENGMSPYISYAESFETVVGNITDPQTDTVIDSLEPQIGEQLEVGIKYEPRGFPALITLAYFDINVSNLDNPADLPLTAGAQLGKSDIDGIELEARMSVGDFTFHAALSTLNTEDPDSFALASNPEQQASLWVSWQPQGQLEGLRVGAGVRHLGQSVSEDAVVRYETPDYTLGDLMLGYEFGDHWDFTLNIRNVADEEYLTSCLTRGDCFPGVRRTVMGSIRYTF
ncbi:MAG: TonB-dependent siderophore receptor [Pseudomonadota bacterium]